MTWYRLVIEEVKDAEVITSYTPMGGIRASEGIGKSGSILNVHFAIRAHLARIEERLMGYVSQKPANIGLRSQYALRMYSWAKKHVTVGTKRISLSLEQLSKSARAGVGKRCGWKYHQRSAFIC